jgi:hypothetical protein
MEAYRVETTVQTDGTLTVRDLPLPAGEEVEVIILVRPCVAAVQERPSLRGLPVIYCDPFEPAVAEDDWEALNVQVEP